MQTFIANLSPPQLFVGTIYHEECEPNESNDYTYIEEFWEQAPIETSAEQLKQTLQNAGIECVDIEFGDYEPSTGILPIIQIICKINDANLIKKMQTDEAYIQSTLLQWSWQTSNNMIAIYIKT